MADLVARSNRCAPARAMAQKSTIRSAGMAREDRHAVMTSFILGFSISRAHSMQWRA